MRKLAAICLLLPMACAHTSTVGLDMERGEVTVCGSTWAGGNDLASEAAQSCRAGARPVLVRVGSAVYERSYSNCAVYRCR
jgi:hypothetical protein